MNCAFQKISSKNFTTLRIAKTSVAPTPARRLAPVVLAQAPQPNPLRQALTSVVSAISEAQAKSQPSDPLMSKLWNGITRCDLDEVNAALASGASPDEKNAEGLTPLHFFARAGHYKYPPAKIPAAIVKAGADLEAKDANGNTALEVSLLKGWQNISILLLENGAQTKGVPAIKSRLTCPDCKRVVAQYNL